MYNIGDIVSLGDWGTCTLTEKAVAVMLDCNGETVDVAFNYDTAESMVLEGYIAIPVGYENDKHFGAAFASLHDNYIDCWG